MIDYESGVKASESLYAQLKLYTYYIIIAVVSLLAMVFLPLVNSTIGLDSNFPNTRTGWIVWIVCRLIVATLNVIIFHSFVCQAKVNVSENENFKEANKILGRVREIKEYVPKSPKSFLGGVYTKKGTTIFLSTAMTLVAFSQAIFSYNWQDLITYGFCVIMGVVFGIMTMLKVEYYWTHEYLDYARYKMEENNINDNNGKQDL